MSGLETVLQLGGFITLIFALGFLFYIVTHLRKASGIDCQMGEARLKILGEQLTLLREEKAKTTQTEALWNGLRKFEIAKKEVEAAGICSVYLRPHDGKPLPSFKPGQYLTLNFEVPDKDNPSDVQKVVRCYSLSDSPNPEYYRISVKRVAPTKVNPKIPHGLVSNFVHDQLEIGDILNIRAPNGAFCLEADAMGSLVLIAGGVGITPVFSMLKALHEKGSNREVWFFYAVRDSSEVVFEEQIRKMAEDMHNVHVRFCYSNPAAGDKKGEDYDVEGRVSADLFKELLPSNNYHFYTCGPPPMMTAIREGLSAWGVPESHINDEAFLAAPKAKKKTEGASSGTKHKVEFKKAGKTVEFDSSSDSILDLAESNGIELPSGCRAGSCLTCMTALREGDVDYGDSSPSDSMEEGCCLPCISIPKSNIVIDA